METEGKVPQGGEPQEAPRQPEVEKAPPEQPPAPLTQEEKTWAALAHASILLNLVTGVGGVIAAFVIWLVKRQQSRYLSFQSLQAWVYQVVMLVLSVVLWVAVAILSTIASATGVCAPLLCLFVPVGVVAQLALFGYGCYGAYACTEGRDFRYLLLGDRVEVYA